jgi:acyl carrier protein
VWSHIRLHGTFEPGAETLSFDVTILDDEGRELASIEQYSLKKVTATASKTSAKDRAAAPGAAAPTTVRAHEDPRNILPAEGLSALARILHAPFTPQVVVCTTDLHRMIEDEQPASKSAAKEEADTVVRKETAYARPALSTPYEAPDNEVEKAIAGIWQGILGIDQIGVNDDFSELGGNSLLAVQTVANIADAFGVDLPVDAFTRRPTVRGQAETVLELLVSMASEETLEDLVSNIESAGEGQAAGV